MSFLNVLNSLMFVIVLLYSVVLNSVFVLIGEHLYKNGGFFWGGILSLSFILFVLLQ